MTETPHDDRLPPWMAEALRAPVASEAEGAAARARVMAAVRRAPRHRFRPRAVAPRWARRGVLAPGAGALLAAAFTLVVGTARPVAAPTAHDPAATAVVLGDTVLGAALRDTLRLVRFVLAGPEARAASRVALAGDFNGWSRTATPLARDARTGAWRVTVAVPRDVVRFALVVDGTRWVRPAAPTPAPARSSGDSI
jgi:hypothetical protein